MSKTNMRGGKSSAYQRAPGVRGMHAARSVLDSLTELHSAAGNRAVAQMLGAGVALSPDLRAEMEVRFGESFADVRIHDDNLAHASAAAFEAKAYTIGPDIVFSAERYAPNSADGKHLLAHELAHVVQQRRGGAPPALSSAATHEAGADQAAAQVAAGSPSVQVSGAAAVGIARDVETDERRLAAPAGAGDVSRALPLEDDLRMFSPGPEYWLGHEPNISAMSPLRLRDEVNQLNEWLFRQRATTPELQRLEGVRDRLQAVLDASDKRAAAKKPRRGHGAKQAPAAAATPGGDTRPRLLRERSSVALADPATGEPSVAKLTAEYDEIASYLQRDDVSAEDRRILQTELANLEPSVAGELLKRSMQRHAETVQRALTPAQSNDDATGLIETMRRIDNITPLSDESGLSYLVHGHEMILLPQPMVDAIRKNALQTLNLLEQNIRDANDETMADYQEFVDRTYTKHPFVGGISMLRSGENPLNWDETLLSIVQVSNQQAVGFAEMQKRARDPWRAEHVPLAAMAEKITAGLRVGDAARNYLDYKIGLVLEGTAGAIEHLGLMKGLGQAAASVVWGPLGNIIYGGVESTGVQLSEMYYGQRESFDEWAIAFDAISAGVSAKVMSGLLSFGKTAPLWLRVPMVFGADRISAGAGTATRLGLDRIAKRSTTSARDIFGASLDATLDWKQGLLNLVIAGGGHWIRRRAYAPPRTPSPAAPAQAKPAAAPSALKAANENVVVPPASETTAAPQNVVPFAQETPPPTSPASQKLNALLQRQPADQAGSVTPIRKPSAPSEPPSQAQEQQVPAALDVAQKVAVGQTHGADGGGAPPSGLTRPSASSASGGPSGAKPTAGSVETRAGAGQPTVASRPAPPSTTPAPTPSATEAPAPAAKPAAKPKQIGRFDDRLRAIEVVRLPEKMRKPTEAAIADIRALAEKEPSAADRLLTALEGRLEEANVIAPGQTLDPQTRAMLGGARTAHEEARAHPEELQSLPERIDDRYPWQVSEEEASLLQAEFPQLPAAGWRTQRPVVRRPGGAVDIIDVGPTPRGATVPERYHPGGNGHSPVSLEVKNYLLDDDAVKQDPFLLKDFVMRTGDQAKRRSAVIGPNAQQYVIIDVRGQNVSEASQSAIRRALETASDGALKSERIRFLTSGSSRSP